MSVRENLHQLEQAFVEETIADRERRDALQRQVVTRSRRRGIQRENRKGLARFVLLCLVLIATAVLVTVAMFETLFLVMG